MTADRNEAPIPAVNPVSESNLPRTPRKGQVPPDKRVGPAGNGTDSKKQLTGGSGTSVQRIGPSGRQAIPSTSTVLVVPVPVDENGCGGLREAVRLLDVPVGTKVRVELGTTRFYNDFDAFLMAEALVGACHVQVEGTRHEVVKAVEGALAAIWRRPVPKPLRSAWDGGVVA